MGISAYGQKGYLRKLDKERLTLQGGSKGKGDLLALVAVVTGFRNSLSRITIRTRPFYLEDIMEDVSLEHVLDNWKEYGLLGYDIKAEKTIYLYLDKELNYQHNEQKVYAWHGLQVICKFITAYKKP